MATQYQNLSDYNSELLPHKSILAQQEYAIVVADWNPQITHTLLKGAIKSLTENGVDSNKINVIHVPGTVELTFAAKYLMLNFGTRYSAIIVLGCVIQGDTPHFDYVCQSVTAGVTELNLRNETIPVIFGVLTTNTLQQALDRADGIHGNKGVEAAITAIKMANIVW